MKKFLFFLSICFLSSINLMAQGNFEAFRDSGFAFDFLHITTTILVIVIIIVFILTIIRLALDHRIKTRMIEKGVSDKIVEQLLKPATSDRKGMAMKWFLILAGIALGLSLTNWTAPLGLHSLAIMAACISLSFLGYFFYSKKSAE